MKRTFPTPELVGNHPLQYDAVYHEIVAGGTERRHGRLHARTGKVLGMTKVPRFDQCRSRSDAAHHGLRGRRRRHVGLQLHPGAGPTVIDTTTIDPGVHTTRPSTP